jgi:hypothetical protein
LKGRLNTWLLILVAICALSLWLGKDLVRKGKGSSNVESIPAGAETTFAMSAEETPIHLVVLNGTSESGLAREVSLLLGRVGCVVENVGNAPHRDFARSLLVNRRLSDRQAGALARRLGGIRVIREWDGRAGEDAVLVLGADCQRLTAFLGGERTAGGR